MNSHVHRFYRKFADEQAPIRLAVEPEDLIPFYESFGRPSYQCFFAPWTPSQQAGNIYCSPAENTLSDVQERNSWQENLAFPTFLDWLIFYLESVIPK